MNFPSQSHKQPFVAGEVALVGAGSGDPELLTIQAYRFIQQAEVVVYDRLVSDEIMALLPSGCERIYVGKMQGQHRVSQTGINEILVEQAQRNKKVVRLKGGDSLIFGRGSEEAQVLLDNGVACHIVPGLTAASACTSYAGIPLTHRQRARSCTLITGHVKDCGELVLPWDALANDEQTIVIYMGVTTLNQTSEKLIAAGRDKDTPAAIIRHGTRKDQEVVTGTLSTLPGLAQAAGIKPPSLIVVGKVVDVFEPHHLKNLGYLAP
ncbi:uroporphyrinogen-III C-methyltransferase [Thalassotalea agarivorans]|uniref:uroporphyrinogen-III C-methyltransferase n=1 Tax=Thalassotalea agarivorans TaxID=349064 RepID=A0A1H9ZBS7_THASX|nr:uroporphyrinogen-III C-methyltransferase [Thalassotalea agarivorans]SES78296.1 uroporphyrinogen-III C-methyltransferase [Thalassotalea agarivorans]